MRKILMTTALVLPLSLVPAFAQDENAASEDPAMTTQEADGETMPLATEPAEGELATDPAEGEMAADADAAAADEEAMKAELASSGKIAQQQAANEIRLEWITDATVMSPEGAAIGDINDLIVDGETSEMIAAIIGVGGFLGIGEKQIAVPWDRLTVNHDAQEIITELTKEEAEAAPQYVFRERAEVPRVGPAADAVAPEDESAPADGAMAPEDDTMAPADDMMAPMDDTMAPADGTMAPMDDTMSPADGTMAPADGQMMDDEAAPSEMEPMEDDAEAEQPASN
ncbi:PRC-barrel domain-containing protein [Paracoccus salsus]|uniref:PRC-barrel domain-containing protein n=1 Tax=Paracoccus salsus TaxID=2911061 RepID=UPI001F19931C|nr:PRC-barrel domain-containing protein [Paracoccus salsus]MCF3972267.1 PRC-barrel domain-containing protein [Paracoccus salsus]